MKVLLFGKLPPPVGGVTVSVKNLVSALKKKGIESRLLGKHRFFTRYDIAHIHYSNLLKRLLGVILARLLARRVIFTVHGKFLDMNNVYNKLSVALSHGVIVLNERLFNTLQEQGIHTSVTILPSIFEEGFEQDDKQQAYFEADPDTQYALLYACDRNYRDGHEVYGVEFVLNQLERFSDNQKLVLLDISGEYRKEAEALKSRIVYIDKVVNFSSLLKQVDMYLRPTYMDGASVAVQEAMVLQVPVLASDVVDRPEGVVTYRYMDGDDFADKLSDINAAPRPELTLQSVDTYIEFCTKLLGSTR